MAQILPYQHKRFNGTDSDILHPETDWGQILNIPSTFTPTYHTHVLADITDVSAGTLVEATNGSITSQRTWSPSILKQAIEALSDLDTDTNTYLTSLGFSTSTGVLTATLNNAATVTVDLDGRYSLSSHTHSYLPLSGGTLTGTMYGTSIELSSNIKVGNSNTLSNEGFELNGTASVGLRATNANGYVSITPLNTGWAHIYTDRSNFIFNKPVYSIDDTFSSYDADLKLNRAGVTKLTLGTSGATFVDNVTAPTFVGGLSGNASSASTATTLTGLTASIAELNYTDGVTSNIQTQLNTKAPLASPALTGTPTAPTATAGTNTTQLATTAFVQAAVSNLVDTAPGTLDTLNELAAALGDDPNFATTVSTEIGTKVSKAGDTMTGGLTAPNLYATSTIWSDNYAPRTGSQLAVSAGETYAQLTTANIGTSEILWIGGEGGVNVVSSPDNWGTGFAGRHQATLLNSSGNTSFPGTVTAPTFSGSLSGNASTASSAAKLTTARTISLTGDITGSTSFDGSGNVSITATVADDSHNHIIANVDGLQTALDGKLSTTGIAAQASKLELARNINGTAFDGTASITTSFWGSTRTLTIGSTGKSVNGSENVSWSLAEIGAQAAGTYNTVIGTDSDIAASSGSTVVSTISMTDGVVQSHSTRNLDAVRGQDGVDMKFWKGTQAAYNAIGTKDSNTVYFVTG
jgi:hypothetical protein